MRAKNDFNAPFYGASNGATVAPRVERADAPRTLKIGKFRVAVFLSGL